MRVVWVLIASLAIHLLMGLGLLQVPADWGLPSTAANVAEIDIIEKPTASEPDDRLVVRKTQPPDHLRDADSKEKARFLSEDDQRVLQETRARRTGLTRNGQALPPDSWMRTMPAKREPAPRTAGPAFEDMNGATPIQLPKPNQLPPVPVPLFDDAPSTVGERMPEDVSLGDFTALNTDRFKYYSFYSRIEELVRFRWENNLKRAIDGFDRQYLLRVVGRRNWISRIEFWIAPDGRYLSAHIYKEAGVRAFDLAAVNAFREAGVFPNPPEEMVEKDGIIRLQYTFNVHWSPSALVDN